MKLARLLLVPTVLLLAAACADDSSSSASSSDAPASETASTPQPTPTPSAAYDPTSYCEITGRLEQAGEKAFGGLGRDATPSEYEVAERHLLKDNAQLIARLTSAAPPELTDDVKVLFAAMRERAGLGDSQHNSREGNQAEKRIQAFEKKNC